MPYLLFLLDTETPGPDNRSYVHVQVSPKSTLVTTPEPLLLIFSSLDFYHLRIFLSFLWTVPFISNFDFSSVFLCVNRELSIKSVLTHLVLKRTVLEAKHM